ncbi:MAG: hypothetical protein HY530_06575 [Chloroflexi bacterium]|nr:hypothetical protein [Chloroflexota bacterium]
MDEADRLLVILAAIFSFANRYIPNADNMMNSLLWQIPLGMIVVFALERIIQMPFRAYKELQEEKRLLREPPPMTLASLEKHVEAQMQVIKEVLEDIAKALDEKEKDFENLKQENENAEQELRKMSDKLERLGEATVELKEARDKVTKLWDDHFPPTPPVKPYSGMTSG